MAAGSGAFWPAQPSVAPGAKASTILTNLQRGNVPTQNISIVRNVDVYQRSGQGDLDRNDIREWLSQTGDDVDRPDNNGLTMLMWAAAYGQVPTVQLLLNHGVNVNVTGKENGDNINKRLSCCDHHCLQRRPSIWRPAADVTSWSPSWSGRAAWWTRRTRT